MKARGMYPRRWGQGREEDFFIEVRVFPDFTLLHRSIASWRLIPGSFKKLRTLTINYQLSTINYSLIFKSWQ
jgi:hypothetical protein